MSNIHPLFQQILKPFAPPCKHDWQTGIGMVPDVCMSCGETRPHGSSHEIIVSTSLETFDGEAK